MIEDLYKIRNGNEEFIGTQQECLDKIADWYLEGEIDIFALDDDFEDAIFQVFEELSEEV